MYKLTTEYAFQLSQKLFRQTEGCIMGGQLSVTLADIHMIRNEKNIVTPLKSIFCKRFVDDIYTKRRKVSMISYMKVLITITQTLSWQ